MPVINTSQEIVTYSDLVQYVLDAHGVEREGMNLRHARAAVRFAYRDLAARNQPCWNYYQRQRLLQTVASYSTGTVAFDATGGSYERQLTLTGGTWPSWAAFGRVIIDSVHYEVEDRKSSTVITLAETSNPGADVSSTTYEIYRNSYPLPATFGVMSNLWDVGRQCAVEFVDSRSHHTGLQVFYDTPSTPETATVRNTGKYLSGLEIIFGPPPSDIFTYDMLYAAFPRPLNIDEYSAGTVAVTANGTTVTGTNTTFPTNCAGAIMRFSSGPVKPSGYLGSVDGADNQFVMQGVIKSWTDTTHVELEEAVTSTLSGVGYTISDPLDVDTNRMLTALQRMAEAEFSRLAGRQDQNARLSAAKQALREAMETDSVVERPRNYTNYRTFDRATVTSE